MDAERAPATQESPAESEVRRLTEALRVLKLRKKWGVLRVAARFGVDPVKLENAAIALRIRLRRSVAPSPTTQQRQRELHENAERKRAAMEAKYERIRSILRAEPELSDATVAERMGCNPTMVNSLRRTMRQSARSQP